MQNLIFWWYRLSIWLKIIRMTCPTGTPEYLFEIWGVSLKSDLKFHGIIKNIITFQHFHHMVDMFQVANDRIRVLFNMHVL